MNEKRDKRILVEGTPSFRNRTGVGQYVFRLFDALFKIDNANEYYVYGLLFFGKKFEPPFSRQYKNVRYRLIRYLPSKVYNVLSRRVTVPPIDILTAMHTDITIFTNFVRTPLPLGSKSIVFIYDLSFKLFSQYSNDKNAYLMNKEVGKSAQKSDIIVTISENSKKEIVDTYKVRPDKIKIINPAVDHQDYYPRSQKEQTRVKNKYHIKTSYILYAGTIEPRKNIVTLLDAYAQLPKELTTTYSLVLAGGKGWKDEEIYKKLEQYKDLNIILTGYVADEDLPALHSGAEVFVFPSHYEGWGMPPLEAMACGTPVITSNNSSLPEVVGDAGIMLDASDTKGFTASITKVIDNKKIHQKMVLAGIKQAKNFSWQKSAQKLHKIIEELS